MQQAVTVMRAAGYHGVIAIPGVDYANDLSHWLTHMPKDPLHQLIAEAHVYGKQICASTECLDRTYAPVARKVPLIFGETGRIVRRLRLRIGPRGLAARLGGRPRRGLRGLGVGHVEDLRLAHHELQRDAARRVRHATSARTTSS